MARKPRKTYPLYTTGQPVTLQSDIMRYPMDGSAPHVLVEAGTEGVVNKSIVGDVYQVGFGHWSGPLAVHASRLESNDAT